MDWNKNRLKRIILLPLEIGGNMNKKEYKEELKYIKTKTENLLPSIEDILSPLYEIEEILQQAVGKAEENGFSIDIDVEQIISNSISSIMENWDDYKDVIDVCELLSSNLEEWQYDSSESKQEQIQEYINFVQNLMEKYYDVISNSDSGESITEQLKEVMEYIDEEL